MRLKTLLVVPCFILMFASISFAGSSRDNRGDSTIFIGKSVGVHVPSYLTRPYGIGFYAGDSFKLGLEYGSISRSETKDGSDLSGKFTNKGLLARYFLGNSFNILGAIHQRTWSFDTMVEIKSKKTKEKIKVDSSLDADAMVGTIGVGNEWLMDFGLTVSCDWLVGSTLLSSSVKRKVTSTLDSEEDKKEAEKELDKLGKLLNDASAFPGVLILTLGLSF